MRAPGAFKQRFARRGMRAGCADAACLSGSPAIAIGDGAAAVTRAAPDRRREYDRRP